MGGQAAFFLTFCPAIREPIHYIIYMSKNLVIVESPAKAKTIEKFLGKDYHVMSSFGHVRDLPDRGINIDFEHGYAPKYEVSPDKKKLVAELKKAAGGGRHGVAGLR